MDDVARRAGVSRPTVYRYFSDRDALVVEVVTRRARIFGVRAREYISGRPDFPSKIVDGLGYLVRGGRRDPILSALLQPDNLSATSGILTAGKIAERLSFEVWEPILIAAQEAGEMRPEINPQELCGVMADLELMMIGRQDLLDPDGPGVRELVGDFLLPALAA
ncbi:Transcriptional regulator, TetR family [Pseudonocardia sp. Ae168_Ps1]|nr:Transcriptional regulator, TetR family [Pseudonocardia sp. Ae150A_Ps1]OLL81982.1 Transcriptional regulator, TetR family [Pseudonocardia sp. Ae168_Ps1]OLL96077.1 Transcriptional regulator, TetR family [Pseudonocardia sp. Ae356_Ps1]